jgi:hypothetical protein
MRAAFTLVALIACGSPANPPTFMGQPDTQTDSNSSPGTDSNSQVIFDAPTDTTYAPISADARFDFGPAHDTGAVISDTLATDANDASDAAESD